MELFCFRPRNFTQFRTQGVLNNFGEASHNEGLHTNRNLRVRRSLDNGSDASTKSYNTEIIMFVLH